MRLVSSSSSSSAVEEINIQMFEKPRQSNNLFGQSHDLLSVKVNTLKNICEEAANEWAAEKDGLIHKVYRRLNEFIYPLTGTLFFFGGLGVASLLFSRNDGISYSVKGAVSLLSALTLAAAPTALWAIFKKLDEGVHRRESKLRVLLEEYELHNLRETSAAAVMEFFYAWELFEKNPTRDSLKELVLKFDLLPCELPIYPAAGHENKTSSGWEKITAQEAKSICRLFFMDSLSDKINDFGENEKKKEDVLQVDQEFLNSLMMPATVHVRSYFETHRYSYQRQNVVLQIACLAKGILNSYLPQESLNNYSLPLIEEMLHNFFEKEKEL